MADTDQNQEGLSDQERVLQDRLQELGPLIRAQEQAEMDLDPVFVATLRAHLVQGEEIAPHPTFARDLRARLLRRPTATGSNRFRMFWLGSLLTVFLIGAVGVILALMAGRSHHPVATIRVPYPSRADLTYSFPAPRRSSQHLTPTLSLVHPTAGVASAARLALRAPALPPGPATLPAYRLQPNPAAAHLGRSRLGIRAPVDETVSGHTRWLVAADGARPGTGPLHSIAVSEMTGELVYHDRRNTRLPHAVAPLGRNQALGAARHWLTLLGWPGGQMPLRSFRDVPGMPKVRQVVLGWIGTGPAATEAATLWVVPDGSVIEAWVWPPVVQRGVVPSRPLSAAWDEVRRAIAPLAVKGLSPHAAITGTGRVLRTAVVSVLSSAGRGKLFLVPTYRFEGTAKVHARTPTHVWYSLVPGAQK